MSGARGTKAGASAARWREVRTYLNGHRFDLAHLADKLYPAPPRVGSTVLIARDAWLPPEPVDLARIELSLVDGPPAPAVRGTERVTEPTRPTGRYDRYSEAMSDLDPPEVFEDRPGFRILDASLAQPNPELIFGRSSYFAGVDVGEAVAHEFAEQVMLGTAMPSLGELPLRSRIGDPTDLSRRTSILAVTTLTVRRAARGDATFVLHWRDPAKVAHGGGMHQVMPVGVFQPSADGPANEANDFDLWRAMVREYAEEFLGAPERNPGDQDHLDYDNWPLYRQLTRARGESRVRVSCLGLGVDPLTLAADLLTVAVIDADVFDEVFSGLVAANAEGQVVVGPTATGFPFTAETVDELSGGSKPMQAAGAAVLQLAWRRNDFLLDR